MLFQGLATALITPFRKDGSVDFDAYERLLNYQLENGVDALLVLGTTGEPPTLSDDEKEEIIRFAVKVIGGRVPVLVGAGSNSTYNMVQACRRGAKYGADALLVVTPYYNKCTQDGLIEHYRAACEATDLPVIAYNVPGRTGVNIKPETAARMAEKLPKLVGLKEACGNMSQILETARLIQGSALTLYSGDDGLCLPIMAAGGKGLISVASNPAPRITGELVRACLAGDYEKGRRLQFMLQPLFDALFCEVNPIPAKKAGALLGLCEDEVRLPLTRMTEGNAQKLEGIMRDLQLLR